MKCKTNKTKKHTKYANTSENKTFHHNKHACTHASKHTKHVSTHLRKHVSTPSMSSTPSMPFLADFVFLFPYQSVCKFWKTDKISLASFHCIQNGENLRTLIEMFRRKLTASKVILAFVDHLKPNNFFVGQPWWPA